MYCTVLSNIAKFIKTSVSKNLKKKDSSRLLGCYNKRRWFRSRMTSLQTTYLFAVGYVDTSAFVKRASELSTGPEVKWNAYSFVIFISAAHSFFVSQWKNSNFLVRPELLDNDILRQVALGTRMSAPLFAKVGLSIVFCSYFISQRALGQ